MSDAYCYECGGWHPFPPCDLTPLGEAIDAQRCGHRRFWRNADGSCRECRRRRELLEQLQRKQP